MQTKPSRLILALLSKHAHTPSATWLVRIDNWRLERALITI